MQTRRRVLFLAAAAIAAPLFRSTGGLAQAAGDAKVTKEFAGYIASGGMDRCERCTRYVPGTGQDNGTCLLVEGTVSREGWCKFFDD